MMRVRPPTATAAAVEGAVGVDAVDLDGGVALEDLRLGHYVERDVGGDADAGAN